MNSECVNEITYVLAKMILRNAPLFHHFTLSTTNYFVVD